MVQGHWFRSSLLGIALACAPPLVARGLTAGSPAPPMPMAAAVPASTGDAVSTDPFPRLEDGALTGTVVDFASGLPIAGAKVELVPVPMSDVKSVSSWQLPGENSMEIPVVTAQVSATAATNSDGTGRFRLVSVSGAYRVRASAEGYPSLLGPMVRVQARRPVPFLQVPLRAKGTLVVQVLSQEGKAVPEVRMNVSGEEDGWAASIACSADAAGQCVVDVPSQVPMTLRTQFRAEPVRRKAVTKLAPGTSHSVKVTLSPLNRLTGRVLDRQGRPLQGARIKCSGGDLVTVAGEDGVFELAAPERVFEVRAQHLGYCSHTMRRRESEAPLEIVLDPCASVAGRVIDASSGAPLAGAVVMAGGEEAIADTAGYYSLAISDLTRQPRLSASRSGYESAGTTPRSLREGEHRLGVDIPMRARELTFRSRVRGIVLDRETAAPVAGAQIRAGFSTGWRTGEDGRFEIDAPDGKFLLSVEAEGRARWTQRLELRGGFLDLSVPMARESVLTGRVLDDKGNPVRYAHVRLYDAAGRASGVTDSSGEDGSYCLRDVPSGVSCRLTASSRRLGSAARDELTLKVGERRAGVDLTLGPSVTLSGLVVDESGQPANGVPVRATAESRYESEAVWRRDLPGDHAFTGADGRFELDSLPTGTYTVRAVTFAGWFAIARHVRLPLRPEQTPIVLELVSSVLIRGRALDAEGSSVSRVCFSIVPSARSARPWPPEDVTTCTSSDGSFRLGPIQRGLYKLEATHLDRNWRQTLDVMAPADNVEILVPAAASLHGRVVRAADGRPVRTFRVTAVFKREAGQLPGRTSRWFGDVDGWFVLEELPAGPIAIEVASPGLAPTLVGDLRLEPGKALTGVEVRLADAGSIAGVVLDALGNPVAGAEVQAQTSSQEGPLPSRNRFSSTTLTGASGQFKFADLPGGRLTLVARDPVHGECALGLKVIPGQARAGIEMRLAHP